MTVIIIIWTGKIQNINSTQLVFFSTRRRVPVLGNKSFMHHEEKSNLASK